jgi:ABC-type lipoprotein release transport system permease subunit
LAMARTVVVGVAGAIGALVLAFLLSPIAPVGEARLAESSTGLFFDAPVLLLGITVTLVVVVALGIWPAVRESRPTRVDDRPVFARPSPTMTRLTALGAPPSAVIGVRNALERKTGGANVPVGTALLGTVLGVAALCGTLIFGSSLTHLTRTPALYGEAYQLNFTVNTLSADRAIMTSLQRNPEITRISRGLATQVSIGGSAVGLVAAESYRGPLVFSAVTGSLPDGDGQIGLGSSTMGQLHAGLGSTVEVTVLTPSGGRRIVPFRVVSQVAFPVLGGAVGLGSGALVTIPGLAAASCPPGPHQASCRQYVLGDSSGGILIRVASGPRGEETVTHYLDTYRSIAALPVTPTSLINFGEAVNFPLIFGGLLAVFGAATLAHLLLVSVSRRRQEIGLLKVLGFVKGQVVATVGWQATTVALIGIIVGVPLGIVAGRATWHLFASHLGVVPVSIVPMWLVALLSAGIVIVANLLAVGPAWMASRATPGQLLRAQ